MWRVGHASDPLEFLPLHRCSWVNRFDDLPSHPGGHGTYRTLYCSESRTTSLREVFYSLRPSLKVAQERARLRGCSLEEALADAGKVPRTMVETSALVPASIEALDGRELADLRNPALHRWLEREHAELLLAHGCNDLNTAVVRGPHRRVTQAIGRSLYDQGAAGVIYGSKIDDRLCFALFEGRAQLEPRGAVEPLRDILDELEAIFLDLNLVLGP